MNKLVFVLLSPLGTACGLGLLAGWLAWAGPRRLKPWAGRLAGAALLWLWLWSTPLASDGLRGWVESQAGPQQTAALPVAVAVVLGGGVSAALPPLRPHPDLSSAADRVWHAARLYRLGKAPRIVVSGGGRVAPGALQNEAEAMRAVLMDLGVPAAAITLEARSLNTRENARYTAELLRGEGQSRVLLVTSALHMRRALRCFRAVGLEVIAAPTDFEVLPVAFTPLMLLPDAEALAGSGRGLKEVLGWWVGGC